MAVKTKQKSWVRPRHNFIIRLAALVLYPWTKLKYHIRIEPCKDLQTRQCLIIMNHQTAFDQFFVSFAAFPRHAYFVASDDLFSLGLLSKLLSWAVAPIPIKKQSTDVQAVMDGKQLVFNYPILQKIVNRFKESVALDMRRQEAVIAYDIDEYDERLLRHLALGYTKDMITNLKGMPFGVKSLEKRQNELISRLFPNDERMGVNACRLVTRAFELRIIDVDNLEPDEE